MTMLQPFVSETYNGLIWRLQIDSFDDILALEIRNEQDKQTSFSTINLQSGELYLKDFTLPERWLTGIEAAWKSVLMLHYYKHESSPEHQSVIAIDAKTGEELWANYRIAFDHLSNNGPVVYYAGMQPKKLQLISASDGKLLRNFSAMEDKPLNTAIVIPDMLPAEAVPDVELPLVPYGNMVHYLTYNNYRIVSLHAQKNGILQQHLYVLDNNGILYHDLLNSNIQKLQPEAFVVHKNVLIYVKERAGIVALKL